MCNNIYNFILPTILINSVLSPAMIKFDIDKNVTNAQLDWTDGGKDLLIMFHNYINNNGGAQVLARKIEWQYPEFFGGVPKIKRPRIYSQVIRIKPFRYSESEDNIIKAYWNKSTISEINSLLPNRSIAGISNRAYRLGLARKVYSMGKRKEVAT